MDRPLKMEKKLALLVLAAGMGSRYGGIKQIDGFGPNGETIMDYSLYDALRSGFSKVVFIVRDEILETVRSTFEPKLRGKVAVEFVVQSTDKMVPNQYQNNERKKPWGTGHAMLCARDVISEPFVAINADDFYGHKSFSAMADFFASDTQGHHAMIGYTLANVLSEHGSVSRGCGESDDNGFLTSVVERTTIIKEGSKIISREASGDRELSPETPTSMNFWGFQPDIFELTAALFSDFLEKNKDKPKAEFYIPIVVNEMVHTGTGKVKILKGSDYWFGVTYQDDKLAVSEKIRQLVDAGEYPRHLWK